MFEFIRKLFVKKCPVCNEECEKLVEYDFEYLIGGSYCCEACFEKKRLEKRKLFLKMKLKQDEEDAKIIKELKAEGEI